MTDRVGAGQAHDGLRHKSTAIGRVVGPVSDLIDGKTTVMRYTNLAGDYVTLDYGSLASHDTMPLPLPVDREGYGSIEDSAYYWAGGHTDWLNVCDAVERCVEPTSERPVRLLDFGCATGRFLRHAHLFGPDLDPWGCDIAPANIAWMQRHLDPSLKVLLTTTAPHLPFPDGYFDVVTAFSVFTHIDVFEEAWLLELRRITTPNGMLYVTVHNDAAWQRVAERPRTQQHVLALPDAGDGSMLEPEALQGPLPKDRMVLRVHEGAVYNCNVWMSNSYIRTRWGRFFEIVDIADNAHLNYQSPVIMRPLA